MPIISRNGKITPYGFACGYYESNLATNANLSQEHGTYLVKWYNETDGHNIKGFRTLTEARKFMRKLPKA